MKSVVPFHLYASMFFLSVFLKREDDRVIRSQSLTLLSASDFTSDILSEIDACFL